MRIMRSKSKVSVVAFVLMLTIAASLITNAARAQEKRDVVGYVCVSPKIAGLNERVTVVAWIVPQPLALAGEGIAGYQRYENMYVEFTKPDETKDTKGPYTSYQEGTIFFTYVPNELGVWSAKLIWDGDYQNNGCESQPYEFTVQAEPAPRLPQVPLPTEYWERPINAENRLWASIAGDWYDSRYAGGYNATNAYYNPYSKAPETAHIVWKHQYLLGGIIGGDFGTTRYASSYQPSLGPITICGRVYYMWNNKIHCLDMYTGEELLVWKAREGTTGRSMSAFSASCDLLIAYDHLEDRPQSQFSPWIWVWNSTNMMKYDAMDGTLMWNMKPPEGAYFGTTHLIPIEGYAYTTMGGTWAGKLVKWDLWAGRRDPTMLDRGTQNFTEKIVWAKDMPAGTSMNRICEGVIYCRGSKYDIPTVTVLGAMDAETGDILWGPNEENYYSEIGTSGYGVSTEPNSADMRWYAYDLHTGELEWVSDPGDYPWSAFWAYGSIAAYGMFYGMSYDGIYAMNAETGKIEWEFHTEPQYEAVYNTLPFWQVVPAAADGKIYVGTGEHTHSDPMLRGCKLFCLDGYTGDEIWSLAFGGAGYKAIADGKLIIGNEYDNTFYCFDKGKTATTVTASPKVSAHGDSVLIEGTVTDQSPAQPGTPCIADEDMSEWMEYLHMQKPMPEDAAGVEVTLDTIDPNGNWIHIDRVTTDMSGTFSHMWTPEIEGKYTIIATFEGSKSYYSSYAETAIGVDPAPEAPAEPEPEEEPAYTAVDLAIIAAVIVAIVIGIVNLWALRKRT